MVDETPLHIIALFLLLSASTLIPYLITEIRSPYDRPWDISLGGFIATSLGILGFSIILFTLLGPNYFLLVAALAIGIGLAILHPVPAICFFVSLLFLRPWEFLPDNPLLKILPRLMAALTAGTWLMGTLRTGRSTFVLGWPGILFTTLLGWMALSSLFSMTPGASLKIFFESFSPTTVLAFLILNSLRTEKDLRAFSRSFVISGVGIMSVAFYTTYRDYVTGASDFRLHGSGLWGNANDLAALAVLMLPLSVIAASTQRPGMSRVGALLATAILLVALLWSQSRAAQGAALLAGVIYVLLNGAGVRLALAIVPAIVVIAVIAAAMPQRDAADTEGSSESRYNYMIAGLRMARARPVFGVGVGNYPYLYEQYTPAFIETGNRTAHSSWILVLSETGAGGLLLLWMLYGSVAARAWRLRKIAPQYVLSIITYGIAMSFLSHTYLFLPYVFMAFILAASRALRQAAPAPSYKCQDVLLLARQVPSVLSAQRALMVVVVVLLFFPFEALADQLTYLGAHVGMNKPIPGEVRPTESAITLKGSRGEILTFFVKAEGSGCFPILRDWEGIALHHAPGELAFFDLPEVTTKNPSFTGARTGGFLDPTVPLGKPEIFCVDNQQTPHWLLGELKIPQDTLPGTYTVRVSAGTHTVTVNVVVWPMVIPDRPTLPGYSELTPWFLVLGHYGKWHEDEATLAQAYSAAMIEHRLIPLKSIVAPLTEKEDGSQVLDLENTPTSLASFNSVVLNNRPLWAYYDFPTVGANGTEPIDYPKAESYFSAVENTIPKIGRDGKAIIYLWDEPKKAAFSELLKLSQLAKRAAPSLKQLVTTPYSPLLKDTVDIFAPVIDQYDASGYPAPTVYRELQKQGHESWWYVSCMSHGCEALNNSKVPDMVIDRPASYIRSIGWLSMRYSIDAFLYYSVNNGFQYAPKRDPWSSLWDFSGNGDGTLFYPGRPGEHGLTSHQPVASLRLKLWRESSFDAEYISWMNKLPSRPGWWENEIKAISPSTTLWDRDYSRYQLLRDKAGEYLSNLQSQ